MENYFKGKIERIWNKKKDESKVIVKLWGYDWNNVVIINICKKMGWIRRGEKNGLI